MSLGHDQGFSKVVKNERDGTRAPDPSPTPPPGDGVAQERGFAESLGSGALLPPSLRKRSFRGEGLGEGFGRRTDLTTTLASPWGRVDTHCTNSVNRVTVLLARRTREGRRAGR